MGRRKPKNRKPKINNEISAPDAVSSSSALPAEAVSPSLAPPLETLSSSATPPPWIELPGDVTANILQRLGAEVILRSAQKVCKTWWKVCQDPAMWRVVYLRYPENLGDLFTILCHYAVDRSQGQLVDLTIERFGDEELINYIANRASNLKRLTLRGCIQISGTSLIEAVKKLPDLEELHLTVMPGVFAEHVEAIGLSCPNLKSFSCNERGSKTPRTKDAIWYTDINLGDNKNEYGVAIGRSMPQLRHLRLFAHFTENEGLEAILDGCPLLKSLDLRQCYKLNLQGDLGKRLGEQIKDLRLPFDSTSDTEWMVGGPAEWSDNEDESAAFFSEGDYYYDDYEYDDYVHPHGYDELGFLAYL